MANQQIHVSVDVALLTLDGGKLNILLLARDREPYSGRLALPGGYIHDDEDQDDIGAARRMLRQKIGIEAGYLEQLRTFANNARDPRGWSVSIAYYALVNHDSLNNLKESCRLVPVDDLPQLPFDHNRIVEAAVERLRNKSSYSSLPCYLLPEHFTLTELQQMYEQVLGIKLDKSSFRRKLDDLGFLEPAGADARQTGRHRPAQLYRIKTDRRIALFDRTL